MLLSKRFGVKTTRISFKLAWKEILNFPSKATQKEIPKLNLFRPQNKTSRNMLPQGKFLASSFPSRSGKCANLLFKCCCVGMELNNSIETWMWRRRYLGSFIYFFHSWISKQLEWDLFIVAAGFHLILLWKEKSKHKMWKWDFWAWRKWAEAKKRNKCEKFQLPRSWIIQFWCHENLILDCLSMLLIIQVIIYYGKYSRSPIYEGFRFMY